MTTNHFLRYILGLLTCATTTLGQVELVPNTIQGTVRFSNANGAILDLLNPPNNEGMSNLYVYAYSLPPQSRTAASDYLDAASRTDTSYEIAVDSDALGIEYVVAPRVSMLGQNQTYYFNTGTSAPVVAFMPGATVDFAECVGVMTVRFRDTSGEPLAVDGGSLVANEIDPYTEIARVHAIPGGTTEQRIYLRGDVPVQLIVTVNRGASTFTDRIQYSVNTNVSVGCDAFGSVDIVVPSAGSLGEAIGNVDMLREFELTVDGYDAGDYPDYTAVTAQYGPFGNKRYAAVPGVNFSAPSSGLFTLSNLVPSTLDPALAGYVVSAEMYVRSNEAIQYFRTPALGSGANPPLEVTPGASIDLGNLFVIDPGYLRGSVLLQGPAESLGRASLLRGLRFASDFDTDSDGIPEAIGIYGVYYSSVAAVGVDRPAPGATFTASYGYGYTGYKGIFNPVSSAYEGQYELALGGLNGEPTLWNRPYLNLTAFSETGVSEADYYYFGLSITDTAPADTEIIPTATATSDAAYCLSEVCITFRSTEPFYSPNIRFSYGGFTNVDFQGRPASYSVYVDPAYGSPTTQAGAATTGQVTLYLPQGDYRLVPYVTPADSTFASVSGDAIELTVGCGQRICVDTRLQLNVTLPTCAPNGQARVTGAVNSFGNDVARVAWQIDSGEFVTVCEDCGADPALDFMVNVPPGVHTLTVRAEDGVGGVSTVAGAIVEDNIPPVIQCPADITTGQTSPTGTPVSFAGTATDNVAGPITVNCNPPGGSLFPAGTTVVECLASDACANTSRCAFNVTVQSPTNACVRVVITPPMCTPTYGFLARAEAFSCEASLTNLSLRASPLSNPSIRLGYSDIRILEPAGTARTSLQTAHGLWPEFDGYNDLSLYRDILYTAETRDNKGRVAIAQFVAHYDVEPPVIQCSADLAVEQSSPCGAAVSFSVTASDLCDKRVTVVCEPPDGSVFPVGETAVLCTATDDFGNSSQCSFNVTVNSAPAVPLPTLNGISPALLGLSGGAQVAVTGTGLTANDEILLDGVSLLYPVLVSAGEIQGQTPPLPAGAHELQVRRCGEIVARLPGAVTVAEQPSLTSVEPNEVYARGGARVLVRGSNLRTDTLIRVGFPAADGLANLLHNIVVAEDGLSLTGEVPSLPPGELFGPRDVIAEDARGQSTLAAALSYLPNPLETDSQIVSLRALEAACAEPPYISFRNGFPVAMNVSVHVPGADGVERARHFLRAYKDLLRQTNPDGDLVVRRTSAAPLEHVAFAQQYRGVPVFGGSVVVSLAGDEVLALTGSLLPPAPLDEANFNSAPTLSAAQAEEIARQQLALPGAELLVLSRLQIYDESVLAQAPLDPHLVWRVALQGAHQELFIDAHTGAVVSRLTLTQEHGGDLDGFDLDIQDAENEANATDDYCFNLSNDEDVANENGIYPDYANNVQGVLAFFHAQNCYSFFHRRFNWHSYDNDSSQVEIFIRADVPNAAWSDFCELIQIRDGWVDFEVIVHEFTHGVIRSTSDLIYNHQAGALNESYADMMALIADREAGDSNWLIGENRTGVAGSVRDLQNVAMDRLSKYVKLSEDNDNGGVHSYSGIPNRAGYFMMAGGMTNGVRVLPMSQDKVRMLKWEALRNLPESADFQAARTFEVATAIAWAKTGTLGFNNNDVCTVRNAWAAVEVGWGDADCNGTEDRPSDIDGDYWPDIIDNCRNKANINQADVDGDGRGDVCDNCPNNANPGQEDLDGDGKGDACDDDIDGDGCKNNVDQHPTSAVARVGTYFSATCNPRSGEVYASESGNHDGDALRDCEDLDDDGDGIPDDLDPCPLVFGADPAGCRGLRDCPAIPKDWFFTCLGGGCVQLQARFRNVINPDPTHDVVFDAVQIVNQTLYLQVAGGNTVQQAAKAIAPRAALGQFAAAAAGGVWRVELWTRPLDGQPARLVAVVGDYDPGTVNLEQTESGSMLAFTPGPAGTPPTLGATWHIGGDPAAAGNDTDQDGLPDGWEIRYGLNPGNPSDALADTDGDGVNNRDEFLAGTNPVDAASALRIVRLERRPQDSRVEVIATPGLSFQLEKTAGLAQPQWTPVGPVVHGQGGVATLIDPNPSSAQSFYRLRLVAQ